MITCEMVRKGYKQGIIKLEHDPNSDDILGVVATIGENYFYFGGYTAEVCTVSEYKERIIPDCIVADIYDTLESFRRNGDYDEYEYYETYLKEHMKEDNKMNELITTNCPVCEVYSGAKIKLINKMGPFTNIGEVCEVVSVSDGMISFKFGNGMHMGMMSYDELPKYFEVLPPAPSVTQEDIDEILENSDFEVTTVYGKCTVVSCRLPNGFIIVESSACVDGENYDEELGENICRERIESKLWELEGYALQKKLYEQENK